VTKREPSSSMGISRERSRAAMDSQTRIKPLPDRMEYSPPSILPNLSRQPSTYPPPNSTTYSSVPTSHLESTKPGSGGRGQAGGGDGQGEGDEIRPIAAGCDIPIDTEPPQTAPMHLAPLSRSVQPQGGGGLRDVAESSRWGLSRPLEPELSNQSISQSQLTMSGRPEDGGLPGDGSSGEGSRQGEHPCGCCWGNLFEREERLAAENGVQHSQGP
jgi:hypothetical protein